jgi:hypothetical protein
LGFLLLAGLPLWAAGLDQATSPLADFAQAVHHIVLEDYIAAVEAAEARHDRLSCELPRR